jgi:gamma-glutamylcyclotransferase (GGCT)/AIG2-like uncharacterized protein YtfP
VRNTNKRSEGYKTRAERKKEKKELKRKLKMEKKVLIGLYDDYRKDGCLNNLLDSASCKLIGTYSTEPIYNMYIINEDDSCVVETNGNTSIKVEVWEVSESYLEKIERNYNYYPAFDEYPQDYKKESVLSPFGEIEMYFINIVQPKEDIIVNGDWIEYLNYRKVIGNKKENVL